MRYNEKQFGEPFTREISFMKKLILYVSFSSVRPMVLSFRNFHNVLISKKGFLCLL